MHIQGIQNMINQIAMMPALNYQPSYSTNPNGTPNFNPNATVDEIYQMMVELDKLETKEERIKLNNIQDTKNLINRYFDMKRRKTLSKIRKK